ncbi:MAG TPA: GPI anchored serine-threonine rich family protein [Acidobacteriota bacterium]
MKKSVLSACLLFLGVIPAYAQTIHVTSPAAGASWCRGQSNTITWTSTGAVGTAVRIRLMRGTAAVQEITLDTANDGSFDWPVPAATAPGSYTVRVRSKENATVGESAAFTIAACGSGPPVAKKAPVFDRPSPGLGADTNF